jgi:PKD repeat protein
MKCNQFKIFSGVLILFFLEASCHKESESSIPEKKPKAGFIVLVDSLHNTKTIRLFNVSRNATYVRWDFGDGNISIEDVNEYTYSNPGTYIVTLIASEKKFTDTFSDTVSIIQGSSHKFTFADSKAVIEDTCGCVPFEAFFEFKNDGSWINPHWNFGDEPNSSNFSNENIASHLYDQAGNYKVDLDIQNYDTSLSYSVGKIFAFRPVAYFACTPEVSYSSHPEIKFYNSSQNCRNSYWSFGDGFVSKELNPKHLYESTGDYTVRLIVQDEHGCFDSTSFKVRINLLNDKSQTK